MSTDVCVLPSFSSQEKLRLDADEARARAAKMQRLEEEFGTVSCSDALLFFQRVVSSRVHLTGFAELSHYLDLRA